MTPPEAKIPAGIKVPLEDFPEIERIEPITEPASQQVRTPVPPEQEPDRLLEVEEIPTLPAYIPDPMRQRTHKRLGGSTPDPEGQATAEREPVEPIAEADEVFGAEQARSFLERRTNSSEQTDESI